MQIIEVDLRNDQVRKELISYLAEQETKALFLVGNLQESSLPSFVYVAKLKGKMVGVCGYYPSFGSVSIFSENAEASTEFAKVVIKQHSISALLGMADMAKPAYEVFVANGMVSKSPPEQFFLELKMDDFKPYVCKEGKIRAVEEKDEDTVVLLMRQLHGASKAEPITEAERLRVRSSSVMFCLEIEDQIVCIASSNGMAIKAFQILGVVTDPKFQKRGFAKAVCSHLISYMKNKGARNAVIFTGKENIPAQKCYFALGFNITDKYFFAMF
ncbi:MAG: GNAT family N-acetyltransferase [Chlamydiota bacterium]